MDRRNSLRRFRNAALVVLAGGMMLPGAAQAVVNPTTYTWIGATSGATEIWNDGANWSYSDSTDPGDGGPLTGTGVVPGLIGQTYPGQQVTIGETTGDRTITTPAVALNVYSNFSLVQTPTSSGVNTLKLGANFGGYGLPWSFYVNNTTGSAAKMVIDLNGHSMGGYIGQYNGVTFVTSAAGGEVTDAYGPGIYNSVISSGVTVAAVGWMFSGGNTNTWMTGSRLLLRGGVQMYTYGDQQAYRLEIGESASATQGSMQLVNNWAQSVKQDVVIYAPTNLNPLTLGGSTLSVGGNFTDYGTAAGAPYTGGYDIDSNPIPHSSKVIFNGSPVTPQTVSIGRNLSSNMVDLQVGISSADRGNIKLGQNLTMAGDFRIVNGSSLDLGDPMLTAGSFTQLADPLNVANSIEIGVDLTGVPGSVQVNGDLTLNNFTLHVYGHTDLTQDLVLFTYTGNLIGTPNLVGITIDTSTDRFFYDAFVVEGGQVKLTNAFIPEPASLGLLSLGGTVLLRRRRR